MSHDILQTMNKLDGKEMDGQAWDNEIAELTGQQSPEKRAYLIIRNFFELRDPSEEMCMEFKEWFASEDTEIGSSYVER